MKEEANFYRWNQFNFWQRTISAIYFLVYVWIRLELRLSSSLFNDEQVTAGGLKLPFWEWLTKHLPASDYHFATLYLPLYPIGHWISENPKIICIPYALVSCFFYWIFLRVNWLKFLNLTQENFRFDPIWVNVFATILMTHNATLILHAFVIRPYAVLGLLAICALIVSNEVLLIKKFSFRYALALSAIILTHNFGILMLAVYFSYHAVRHLLSAERRAFLQSIRKRWFPVVSTMLVGGVLAFPIWFHFIHAPTLLSLDTTSPYDPAIHKNVHEYLKPGMTGIFQVAAIYYGFKRFRWFFFLLVVLGAFRFLIRRQWTVLLFPVITVIIPTIAFYLFALYSKYWFIQRTFIWVMPFHAVFVAAASLTFLSWSVEKLPFRSFQKVSHA